MVAGASGATVREISPGVNRFSRDEGRFETVERLPHRRWLARPVSIIQKAVRRSGQDPTSGAVSIDVSQARSLVGAGDADRWESTRWSSASRDSLDRERDSRRTKEENRSKPRREFLV